MRTISDQPTRDSVRPRLRGAVAATLEQMEPRYLCSSIEVLDGDGTWRDPDAGVTVNVPLGHAIHVRLKSSVVDAQGAVNVLQTRYDWNFNDAAAGAEYDDLRRFNAPHLYKTAGTKTIFLTIDRPGQSPVTEDVDVTIDSAARTIVYVAPTSLGNGSGTSQANAMGINQAITSKMLDNHEWQLQTGVTYNLTSTIQVTKNNFVMKPWDTGAKPIVQSATGSPSAGGTHLSVDSTAKNVTIQGVAWGR